MQVVANGGKWFSQKVAAKMAKWIYASPGSVDGLSAREIQVLKLLAKGMSNQEIADHLSIAERTVRFHLRNTYDKLRVSSRGKAIAWAYENGLSGKQLREAIEAYLLETTD